MSDDKILKTSKELKIEEEKEAEIVEDIEEAIKGSVGEPVVASDSEGGGADKPALAQNAAPGHRRGGSFGGQKDGDGRDGGRGGHSRRPRPEKVPSEFEEKMLTIDRVTRVVKGGRRMRFRALVVIGDKKGRVGYGLGKGNEVAIASQKAVNAAKKKLLSVDIATGTILHDTWGKSRGSQVLLKSAKKGRGIIAGGSVRTVMELAGYSDVVAKSFGSTNKTNTVAATFEALKNLKVKPGKKLTDKQRGEKEKEEEKSKEE